MLPDLIASRTPVINFSASLLLILALQILVKPTVHHCVLAFCDLIAPQWTHLTPANQTLQNEVLGAISHPSLTRLLPWVVAWVREFRCQREAHGASTAQLLACCQGQLLVALPQDAEILLPRAIARDLVKEDRGVVAVTIHFISPVFSSTSQLQ